MTSPIDNSNDTIGPEPILGDHVNTHIMDRIRSSDQQGQLECNPEIECSRNLTACDPQIECSTNLTACDTQIEFESESESDSGEIQTKLLTWESPKEKSGDNASQEFYTDGMELVPIHNGSRDDSVVPLVRRISDASEDLDDSDKHVAKRQHLGLNLVATCRLQASGSTNDFPRTFREAMASTNKNEWEKASDVEVAAHKTNGTFELVKRPKDRKPVSCR